jgi:hypothetical protein
MGAHALRMPEPEERNALPRYELRARRYGPGDSEIEVWQLPAPATPQVKMPLRIAGLRGRNLELVEIRVLRRLAEAGIRIDERAARGEMTWALDEELALVLGLLFRELAPMRSRDNIRAVAEGIDAMSREEAGYWLGMAIHRKYPRRVLTALRILLTDPKRPSLPA